MEILVTGKMTYVTKLVLKRLVEAGHKLTYRVNGFNETAGRVETNETPVGAEGDWLIDGVAAFSLPGGNTRSVPLQLALNRMLAGEPAKSSWPWTQNPGF